MIHEVPDSFGYGYYAEAPVYDGFGNPVGLPFLAPIASALAPMAGRLIGGLIPGAGQAISRLLPGAGQAISQMLPGAAQAAGQLLPQAGQLLNRFIGGRGPRPFFRAPPPVGWVTPALPFTGQEPRRMYMRCAVWPGPNGMVPGFATQALPAPGTPAMPGAPGAMPMPMPMRRRRRRRR
jgi:hypothetical protein